MRRSDFSDQFETFRFINTKQWMLGENIPQVTFVSYARTDTRRVQRRLRIAVIPGLNERNFEFRSIGGCGYRV